MSRPHQTITAQIEETDLCKKIANGFQKIADCAVVTFTKKKITIQATSEGNICIGILEVLGENLKKYRYHCKEPSMVMVINLASLVRMTKPYKAHLKFSWTSENPDQVIVSCVEKDGYILSRENKLNLEELMTSQAIPVKEYGPPKRILSAAYAEVCTSLFPTQIGSAKNVPFSISHSKKKRMFLFTIYTNGDRNGDCSECKCKEYQPDELDDDSDDGDYPEELDDVMILNPELNKAQILKTLCSTTNYFRIHYATRMEMAKIVFDLHEGLGTCTIILPTMSIR